MISPMGTEVEGICLRSPATHRAVPVYADIAVPTQSVACKRKGPPSRSGPVSPMARSTLFA
jgi:hypothetical protein